MLPDGKNAREVRCCFMRGLSVSDMSLSNTIGWWGVPTQDMTNSVVLSRTAAFRCGQPRCQRWRQLIRGDFVC